MNIEYDLKFPNTEKQEISSFAIIYYYGEIPESSTRKRKFN